MGDFGYPTAPGPATSSTQGYDQDRIDANLIDSLGGEEFISRTEQALACADNIL
jgi:hypothetical protein